VDVVLDCVCHVLKIERSMLMIRQRDSVMRPVAAKALCDHAGMTQRKVAEVFNLSAGGTVSKQLAKLSKIIKKDKTLSKNLTDIDRMIQDYS
jgi:hypothetical protein